MGKNPIGFFKMEIAVPLDYSFSILFCAPFPNGKFSKTSHMLGPDLRGKEINCTHWWKDIQIDIVKKLEACRNVNNYYGQFYKLSNMI